MNEYKTLTWTEQKNEFKIDCSLEVFVSPANNNIIFITIPGVDGSIDGYKDKYKRITENMQKEHGVATVRMSNPFISSSHWDNNIRQVLDYILANKLAITEHEDIEIHIMAHSAGAAIIAQVAWEYPEIKKLLLVNTAFKMNPDNILKGLPKYTGDVRLIFGSKDPSIDWAEKLKEKYKVTVIDGVDHNFSGEYIETFIELPTL
jgi:pimeloyl-ACP methyl ester carboxylesterase